jgi:predicted TIM-barrel fold metal-dependent hydrolase
MPPPKFFDEEWLALRSEPALEPDLPIIDAHHHLWDRRPNSVYLLPELLADITGSGHNVRGTVFVECAAMYRADGDPRFASVGEVEFVNGVAAICSSGIYGDVRACAGVVGCVDLTGGEAAADVLHACIERAPDRFRGIRCMAAWDPNHEVNDSPRPVTANLLENTMFRAGFSLLAPLGLSFDAWVYHPQLHQVTALADAFPNTSIVLNHMGGRVAIGPYATQGEEAFKSWSEQIRELAKRPNVTVKIGGVGMRLGGFGFHDRELPPTSVELAAAARSSFEVCIEAFGPVRAMFEGNFPVDKSGCSYSVVWNAFKRLAGSFSPSEKAALFAGNATRVYRLPARLGMATEAEC